MRDRERKRKGGRSRDRERERDQVELLNLNTPEVRLVILCQLCLRQKKTKRDSGKTEGEGTVQAGKRAALICGREGISRDSERKMI